MHTLSTAGSCGPVHYVYGMQAPCTKLLALYSSAYAEHTILLCALSSCASLLPPLSGLPHMRWHGCRLRHIHTLRIALVA